MLNGSSVVQGSDAAFGPADYAARIGAASALLAEHGIDVYLVTSPENIFYLTGQQTPGYFSLQALVLSADRTPFFIARQLEYHNLVANTFISDIEIYPDGTDLIAFVADTLKVRKVAGRRLAIDKRGWFLPIALYEGLVAAVGAVADAAGLIERLRAVKSPREIEKIAAAAAYVDAGLEAGLAAVRMGVSENELAAAMMAAAIRAGSEYVGMEPLVSVGPRSGVPHATWRRRKASAGEPCFLEMAAAHDRYHAALLRTAWIGPPPAEAADMFAVCEEALAAAIDAMRPGEPCSAVHAACQAVIDRHGHTNAFRKRTGYSMGIAFAPDWGEGNVLSLYAGVDEPLVPGMAFFMPLALRVHGVFTVGVGETVLVTEGAAKVLGKVPRGLHVVAAAPSGFSPG